MRSPQFTEPTGIHVRLSRRSSSLAGSSSAASHSTPAGGLWSVSRCPTKISVPPVIFPMTVLTFAPPLQLLQYLFSRQPVAPRERETEMHSDHDPVPFTTCGFSTQKLPLAFQRAILFRRALSHLCPRSARLNRLCRSECPADGCQVVRRCQLGRTIGMC